MHAYSGSTALLLPNLIVSIEDFGTEEVNKEFMVVLTFWEVCEAFVEHVLNVGSVTGHDAGVAT